MQLQLPPERPANCLLGQIIVGRSQTSGSDNNVRPAPCCLQSVRKPLRVVSHYSVAVDRNPQRAELFRNHLGIGVGNIAQQQLRTDSDQFRDH